MNPNLHHSKAEIDAGTISNLEVKLSIHKDTIKRLQIELAHETKRANDAVDLISSNNRFYGEQMEKLQTQVAQAELALRLKGCH